MAQIAYELERFAPAEKRADIRVAKRSRVKKPDAARGIRIFANGILITMVVMLACGVLYTQTTLNELQGKIDTQKKEFTEQQALNAYLTLEMENISNIKDIEDKAISMGMVKMNGNQITYIQVEEGESIEIKETGLAKMFSKANDNFMSIMDNLKS